MNRPFNIWLSTLVLLLILLPHLKRDKALAQTNSLTPSESLSSEPSDASASWPLLPLGVIIEGRTLGEGVFVRGYEDGTQAIAFEQWRIGYEDVIQVLQLKTESLSPNEVKITAPGLVTVLNLERLVMDPELGPAFTLAQLQQLFEIQAQFDINEYALQLNFPGFRSTHQDKTAVTAPIQLQGLPTISAPTATLSTIKQTTALSGSQNQISQTHGEIEAVGTLWGGSLYTRITQTDLMQPRTWSLTELQYARLGQRSDYFVGALTPFWPTETSNDLWGVSTVQRWGFTPPLPVIGGSNPHERLQSAQTRHTITGRAEPGSVVRLVQGFQERVVDEVFVDASGTYRFPNIVFDEQTRLDAYRILVYPQGRLTATPEIRPITISAIPGQLPQGASALIASAGVESPFARSSSGQPRKFQGGAAFRWGQTEDLTLGLGMVYDDGPRGVADLFFQPKKIPLTVSISALTDRKGIPSILSGQALFEPTPNLRISFNREEDVNRLDLDWQVRPGLSFFGRYDSHSTSEAGTRFHLSNRAFALSGSVTATLKNQWRWNLASRISRFEFDSSGNETGFYTGLTYRFSPDAVTGHAIALGHDRQYQSPSNHLTQLLWQYRSPQQNRRGHAQWSSQLGLGVGSQGVGAIASIETSILPGLGIRATYRGISLSSRDASYGLELVPSLRVQNGIQFSSQQIEELRARGGVSVQTYVDQNHNGKLDRGEDIHLDPNLLILNNQPVQAYQQEMRRDRILLPLPPGTYRLELDPAGLPLDAQAIESAFAVDVVAGSYTPVRIPLTRSYTVTGIARGQDNQPLQGARVEAIAVRSNPRRFSITNQAGVFYLEGLRPGRYQIMIHDQQATPSSIELTPDSNTFQQQDFYLSQ